MSDEEILQHLVADKWVEQSHIAVQLGTTARSVAQRLRVHVRSGLVKQSETSPRAYLLVGEGGGALVTVDEPPEIEAPPPACFAIWDDGSMSITRGQESMYLTIEDFERLAKHVARFRG